MKLLVCEMCGGTDLIKKDGVFVCQYCGCKYSVEEAKKMMTESKVDVSGSTVKIDTSSELQNLYQLARRSKSEENYEKAEKYYDMILLKEPNSWEASFYVVYCSACICKIAGIASAGQSVSNCLLNVFNLIKDNVDDKEKQISAFTEVADNVISITTMLYNASANHFNKIDFSIRQNYIQEWLNNSFASVYCVYELGNYLEQIFGLDEQANTLSVKAWKQGIEWHKKLIPFLNNKKVNREQIKDYVDKIRNYDPNYTLPKEKIRACYIATAVYGSYDCPQVWTLRRYRDGVLAQTWYGRAFIHTYYAISPLLVKLFGNTKLFKKIWRVRLDRIVNKLQNDGFKNTPYNDQNW